MAARNINAEQLQEMIRSGREVLVDFWAPWCTYCRRMEPAFEQIAKEYGDRIEIVKLNMDESESLWQEFGVELIPTLRIYRGGAAKASVTAPESKEKIDEFLQAFLPQKQSRPENHVYDMIVIGGGPGGYTAALYAARAGLDVLVLEKLAAGGQMALSHRIDNYPGFADGVEGFELARNMQRQAERFGAATLHAQVQSVALHANPKVIRIADGSLLARTVVISTGANPRELGAAGERELVGKGVAYCAACDGVLFRDKTVVVVGGGNTAAADALLLSRVAKKVILVHRRDSLRATKIYHAPLMNAENVEFRWNSVVTELTHEDRLNGVRLRDVNSGEETEIACDGLFVSVGRKPASELFAGQLELDAGGYIAAGEDTRTSIPGVYAVGDVRAKLLRQVVTAVSDGAMAVHMAEEYLAENA